MPLFPHGAPPPGGTETRHELSTEAPSRDDVAAVTLGDIAHIDDAIGKLVGRPT